MAAAAGLVIWTLICLCSGRSYRVEALPFVPTAVVPHYTTSSPTTTTTTTTTTTNTTSPTSDQNMIRLVNGTDRCSGRVEVFLQGQWGSVCDDHWDMREARVVCRMLGCGPAVQALTNAHYGASSGQIWLDEVQCTGEEPSLRECGMAEPGEHDCGNHEDAGVMCQGHGDIDWTTTPTPPPPPPTTTTDWVTAPGTYQMIRLNGTNSTCSGRVEVFHQGQWGSVCDDHWDMDDAQVVCREVGCGAAVQVHHRAHHGQADGPIWLDNVQCLGHEHSLSQCSTPSLGDHNCGHDEDAGVTCQGHGDILMTLPPPTPPPDTYQMIRLVNGTNECSGRVEVYHQGQWGSVCDDRWDMDDAQVVCREVGCGAAVHVHHSAHHGQADGPIWLDNVQCLGHEHSLSQCSTPFLGEHNCGHSEDAGVTCQGHGDILMTLPPPTPPPDTYQMIRLVNGTNECSGRVEVYHQGQWGSVCDDRWDLDDAQVVCREVGCGAAVHVHHSAHHGQADGPIWLDNVQCLGHEHSLSQCSTPSLGDHNCGHHEDAGVTCQGHGDTAWTTPPTRTLTTTPPPPTGGTYQMIRLVNGCSGRVEVYHQGQWGSVCDDHWDLDDAQVVCREVGCGLAVYAHESAHHGGGSGPIWLDDVQCLGHESSLSQCSTPSLGDHNCDHSEDAGVTCQGPGPGPGPWPPGPVLTTAGPELTEAPVSSEPLSLHANFMVGRSGEVRGYVEPVLFDMVVSDTASGFVKTTAFGYDKDTGHYVAPFPGEYSVTVTCQLCVGAHTAAWDLVVDGRVVRTCSLEAGVVGAPCHHGHWMDKGQALSVKMRTGCVWGLTLSGTAWESEYLDYWYYFWSY